MTTGLAAGGMAHAMSATDRRLNVAVLGFELDEAAAEDALAAGADINHRNEAMDNDTLLIGAIRQFKDPSVVMWLLERGADPSLTNAHGRSALSYARQYKIGNTPAGRAVMARLGAAAGEGGNGGAAEEQGREASASVATGAALSTATGIAGAPTPGVYECMNQQAMITPMAFGLIDGSTYMSSGGRRGRYSYDAASGVLTLDPGAQPARFKRTGPTLFRPIRENGELGGFTCPLNRAKSPSRPPW